jgi:hypothetical protein
MKKVLSIIMILCCLISPQIIFADKSTPIPENWIGSELICNDNYNNITITFLGSDASYNNEFGYMNGKNYVKLGKGHDTKVNTTFTIKNTFTKGQKIILYIKTPTGQIYKTGTLDSNSDKKRHAKIFKLRSEEWNIGFEDLPKDISDEDYNDIMLKITGNITIQQKYENPTITYIKGKHKNTYKVTITIPKYTDLGQQVVTFTNKSSTVKILADHKFVIPSNYQIETQVYVYTFDLKLSKDLYVNFACNSKTLNATGYARKILIIPDIM